MFIAPGHGESKVGEAFAAGVLDDHVHINGLLGQGRDDAVSNPGPVGDADYGYLGLIAVQGYSRYDSVLHLYFLLLHNPGTAVAPEGRLDQQGHPVFPGQLHGPNLQHLGSQAGHLQHLLVGDLLQMARLGADMGIGGVDPVHVGINLANIRPESGGQGYRRGIGAAPAQGGDIPRFRHALEAGHYGDDSLAEGMLQLLPAHGEDPGLGMAGVGAQGQLEAQVGAGGAAQPVQSHGQQGGADLFAGGYQHVLFPLRGQRTKLPGQVKKTVGFSGHGGNHYGHLVPLRPGGGDAAGYVPDMLRGGQGASTIFLDNQAHGRSLTFAADSIMVIFSHKIQASTITLVTKQRLPPKGKAPG